MNGMEVRIRWVDTGGNETTDRVAGQPCIRVKIGRFSQSLALDEYVECLALIDTGADHCLLDERIVRHLCLPTAGESLSHGNTGSTTTTLHMANIYVPEVGFIFQTELAKIPSPQIECPFELVLGRAALAHARLVMDGRNGDMLAFFSA